MTYIQPTSLSLDDSDKLVLDILSDVLQQNRTSIVRQLIHTYAESLGFGVISSPTRSYRVRKEKCSNGLARGKKQTAKEMMAEDPDRHPAAIALDVGVAVATVYRWRQEFRSGK